MSMQVHQVAISPEGDMVVIAYTDFPNDVRVKGQVVMQRELQIDLRHPDYREDADLMMRSAQRLLRNALEDFAESEPYEPPAQSERDDDEGLGMGHGPKS